MTNKTFNVNEDNYNRFRELNPGDMSKIIDSFIADCVSDKTAKPQELAKLEAELEVVQKQIRDLKVKSYRLSTLITDKNHAVEELEKAKTKDEIKIEEWADDVIVEAKRNGTLTELTLKAEAFRMTVKDYLVKQWHDSQEVDE